MRGIRIPSSAEKAMSNGFYECSSLNEILFSLDTHLREINDFQKHTSLCRTDISAFGEIFIAQSLDFRWK
jgi:hypothetical protein